MTMNDNGDQRHKPHTLDPHKEPYDGPYHPHRPVKQGVSLDTVCFVLIPVVVIGLILLLPKANHDLFTEEEPVPEATASTVISNAPVTVTVQDNAARFTMKVADDSPQVEAVLE